MHVGMTARLFDCYYNERKPQPLVLRLNRESPPIRTDDNNDTSEGNCMTKMGERAGNLWNKINLCLVVLLFRQAGMFRNPIMTSHKGTVGTDKRG